MAKMKKGQLNQFLFTMVDKTDFATIESGLAAADALIYYMGVNHGGSTAWASGLSALSKVPSLVHSGIFRATVKAAEAAYDQMLFHIVSSGTVSCADQNLLFELTDYDDSDVMSRLSDTLSKLVIMSGIQSDVYSLLSSRIDKQVASKSMLSDTLSKLVVMSGILSDTYSGIVALSGLTSDAHSAATAAASRALINQSRVSDIYSHLCSQTDSMVSNTYSLLSSRVPAVVPTASAFGTLSGVISDVYSGVVALSGLTSDAHSAAAKAHSLVTIANSRVNIGNSRLLVNQSSMSDLASVVSNLDSKFNDRVTKLVANYSQVSDLWSDLLSVFVADASDIASAVWSEKYHAMSAASTFGSLFSVLATTANQVNSRALVNQSVVSNLSAIQSNIYSLLSDYVSDFGSRIPKAPATASVLSDFYSDFQSRVPKKAATDSMLSDTLSKLLIMSDILSNVYSGVTALSDVGSKIIAYHVGASDVLSDIFALTSDLSSNFDSRVGTALATASQVDDRYASLVSAIGAVSVTLSASDISDITSQILAGGVATQATSSDILSKLIVMSGIQSDTYSLLSDYVSDFGSRVPKAVATASALTSFTSNFGSRVPKAVATNSQLSDLHSVTQAYLASMSSVQSNAYSLLSDLVSDFGSRVPKAVATSSQVSQTSSNLSATLATMSSVQSNAYSLLSDFVSDFGSRVPKLVATNSQVSDLVSGMNAQFAYLSSTDSNLYSLVSDLTSDFRSRVPKEVATRSGLDVLYASVASDIGDVSVTLGASDISVLSSQMLAGGVPTASAIAVEVWDEARSGHTTAGTFGEAINKLRTIFQ